MTPDEDAFRVTGPDGQHPVRPGDPVVQFNVCTVLVQLGSMEALRLGNALVLAGSRALQAGVHEPDGVVHSHHWSDDYVREVRDVVPD